MKKSRLKTSYLIKPILGTNILLFFMRKNHRN
jgi:hypothetical protein